MLKVIEKQIQDSNRSRLKEKKIKQDLFPESTRQEELERLFKREGVGSQRAQITIKELFA